ncbi:MAG: branched-chain amino acid ABC transporter permease [Candidatus Eisenbacteria bacterium]|nr:branched-chain amino acid ABC transporter permease [Candidatus Eisenbacteria bacterium]
MQEFLQQLVNGISWGGIYALIALGYTMVYGILRLINFAHGDVYMVGAYLGFYAVGWLGLQGAGGAGIAGVLLVFAVSMAGCALLGMGIERSVYKPVRKHSKLTALITAIGVSLLLENLGILIFGPDPQFFPQIIVGRTYRLPGGVVITNHQILILAGSAILMLLLQQVIYRTRIGKAMRAVSYNRDAASLMGIATDRVILFTFAIGSALAAAAGVLVALQNPKIEPLMGLLPGLKAFVAAVLGGIGNIPGAVVGGLLMGIAETLVAGYISSTLRDAIAFSLLIVILLVKPSGIMGRSASEKV